MIVAIAVILAAGLYRYKGELLDTVTQHPMTKAIAMDSHLPSMLVIGDSISLGYMAPLRNELAGKWNVLHPPQNCKSTETILAHLNEWLGDTKWDMITVNAGLHDIKHISAFDRMWGHDHMVPVDQGDVWVPLGDYTRNLTLVAQRLKATGARVVFVETTPVPLGARSREPALVDRYNAAARSVMASANIPVVPLNAYARSISPTQLPADVHYSREGYRLLATFITSATGLDQSPTTTRTPD